MLGGPPEGSERLLTLAFMVFVQILGLVAIAAVLRRDVTNLNEWKKLQDETWREHLELHSDMSKMLGRMEQLSSDAKERMDRLDNRIDRRQHYRGGGE